jgi:hypothetical protein
LMVLLAVYFRLLSLLDMKNLNYHQNE